MKFCRWMLFEASRALFSTKNWKIYSTKTSRVLTVKDPSRDAVQALRSNIVEVEVEVNSFRRIWRAYGRQVSCKTAVKSLADGIVPLGIRLNEENQLRFSNSKHSHFYWTKKHFISEWYFTKNHETGSLVGRKVKKSWDSWKNRELGPTWELKSNCWSFCHVYSLTSQKASKVHKRLSQSWL